MHDFTPEGYQHHIQLTVRFGDLDALGHLNHARYLTYMEQARIRYVADVCGWHGRWDTLGMILAKATIEYVLPVQFGDVAHVFTRCSRLGGKSFDLEYVLLRQRGTDPPRVAAAAVTVMVAYDYPADRTVPVPDAWRTAMQAYEPALQA